MISSEHQQFDKKNSSFSDFSTEQKEEEIKKFVKNSEEKVNKKCEESQTSVLHTPARMCSWLIST